MLNHNLDSEIKIKENKETKNQNEQKNHNKIIGENNTK